jgi:protein disulfide-isomerase-like protein
MISRSCVALALCAAVVSASDDDFKTDVKVLDSDSFAAFHEGSTPALVMFQAPWCGHCKAFKPLFGKAAKLTNAAELKFGFGTVDCDGGDGKPLCAPDKFNVTSFPTTYFFADKDAKPVKYEDARTTKGIKAFVKGKLGLDKFPGDEKFVNDDSKWEDGGNVIHQTDDHFDAHLKQNPSQFVMFYAPWCGHCKKFKPIMIEASRKVKSAPLVAVDCTEEDPLCRRWNVTGYPTFYWCAGGTQADCEKYQWSGSEDANDVRSYIENKIESAARKSIGKKKLEHKDVAKLRVRVLRKMLKERGLACKGCTDKKEFIKMLLENQDVKVEAKKHKRSWGEEQRYKKSLEVAEKGWELTNEKVAHYTDFSYSEARKAQTKPMLLMFYAPWCTHCKDLKPKWAEGATSIGDDAIVAAIDCDSNEETCGKFKVESFPTLKYFADGKDEGSDYKGGRDSAGMSKFIKGKLQVGAGSAWVGEPVNVKHITDDTLDKYVEEHSKFLLMMYTKTCEKCKAMMPVFAEASGKASDANTGFAAADCATDPKTCTKFGIKTPKGVRSAVLKFVDGGTAVAYKGKKDSAGLSDFAVEMDEEPGKDEL